MRSAKAGKGKEPSALAKGIKSLRERAGLSQQALAIAAGLSISVLSKLEQGTNENPRVNTVRALAKALGVAMEDLFKEK